MAKKSIRSARADLAKARSGFRQAQIAIIALISRPEFDHRAFWYADMMGSISSIIGALELDLKEEGSLGKGSPQNNQNNFKGDK